jgi:murein DD-endopeptidase MepM/ murein hydrolase activator NlpD
LAASKILFKGSLISYIIPIAFFVDKPNMAIIIEKQHIAKRRRNSSFRPTNKSAGFNNGFMNQFQQKPAHNRKKSFFRAFPGIKHGKFSDSRKKSQQKSSGFSFPVPSLATLAIIAGTIVIALAALNWEGIDISTPDIYAFQPFEGTGSEERILKYAATGISSIINPQASSPVSAETGSDNAENDNPHGMLVTFEWQQYRVQRGDSVSRIAQRFGVSVGAIIASNNISNARRLQEGTVLRIPNIDGIPYQIQRGDSLSRIAASFNVPLEVVLDINDIKSDNIKPGETLFIPGARMNDIDLRRSLGDLFIFPLPGRRHITSSFGMRKDPFTGALQFHDGVDFRANTGTTVMAAMDGVISTVGENRLYGKFIIMSHSNGYKTLYGHLNSFSVREGDRVARGRKIGESGNTGYSTGPHLHFGIYDRNNRAVNPLELIN